MADFRVDVLRIDHVMEIEDANSLDVAQVKGYQVVVGRNSWQAGDLAAYLPTDSLLPQDVVSDLGLEGMLSGPAENRIKPRRLRGVVSEGLLYPLDGPRLKDYSLQEGDDVTELIGAEKFEPDIPIKMRGIQDGAAGLTIKYDFESILKYPEAFRMSENVEITEKIHGTWTCLGYHPDKGPIVTSKGLSSKEVVFKVDAPENANNLYVRQWLDLEDTLLPWLKSKPVPFYIMGEIYGGSVQDLDYGIKKGRRPGFRVFDAYEGQPRQGRWLDSKELDDMAQELGLDRVPVLYRGRFRKAPLGELSGGKSVLADHIREGAVIKADPPRYSEEIGGRAILKMVSDKYKLRRKGTEYN